MQPLPAPSSISGAQTGISGLPVGFLELKLRFPGSQQDFWSSDWASWAPTGISGLQVGCLELKLGFLEL